MKKKDSFFVRPGVISILLTGLLFTGLAFQFSRREIQKSAFRLMEEEASIYTGMITSKADQYITLMQSFRGFFKYSEEITRDEFAGFTSTLVFEEPGLKALFWAPRVSEEQRPYYEIKARVEGFSRFEFRRTPNSDRQEKKPYFPVYYIEPFEENSSVFGYDMSDDKEVFDAFEKSIQTGCPTTIIKPSLSGQATHKTNNNCWVITPVFYQHGLKCTEQGRRQSLQGYLIGVFDFSVMVDSILGGVGSRQTPMEFCIEDITDGGHSVLLQGTSPRIVSSGFDKRDRDTVVKNKFRFTDRIWEIYCFENEQSYFRGSQAWQAWLVLPAGGALIGLLMLYLYGLYHRRELADDLVEKRTRELKEQKERADTVTLEAERSNRAKSEFLATMNHDIRTQMNAIVGFCEVLAEEPLAGVQKDHVNIIHDSSKNLLALLNDILDLSKIETGKMYVAKRDCSLQELLNSIGTMFGNSSQARELDFRIIPCVPLPQVIHTDAMRVQQCLVNLIGNALKFTHQGHVYVRILFEENHLKFEVEDTGVGIPQILHEVIFKAFTRADDSTSRDYSGNGLGLTITRRLARLMGGDVTLKSQVGQGSTFTLDIPVNIPSMDTQQTFQDAGIADHEIEA